MNEDARDWTKQTIVTGIEAIFILLVQSDFYKHQDPISFRKMKEMMVSYLNKLLGKILDTHRLNVDVPPSFVAYTLQLLNPFHYKHNSFTARKWKGLLA